MLTLLVLSTATPRAAPLDVSRSRLTRGNILGCGSAIGIAAAANAVPPPKTNVTEALEKNKVVVRRQDLLTEVVVDPKTGDELRELQLPAGYPKSLRPPRLVERRVSEAELALAAVVAGGTTEIARVAALHPLATLKSRAQARPGTGPLALIDADGNGTVSRQEYLDAVAADIVPGSWLGGLGRRLLRLPGLLEGVPDGVGPCHDPRRAVLGAGLVHEHERGHLLPLGEVGHVEHGLGQEALQDGPQPAGARAAESV